LILAIRAIPAVAIYPAAPRAAERLDHFDLIFAISTKRFSRPPTSNAGFGKNQVEEKMIKFPDYFSSAFCFPLVIFYFSC